MLKPIFPIFFFCFSILKLTNSQLTETQSLLEFKKGISGDPSGKVFNSWVSTPSQQNPSSCPDFWYGISCDFSSSASVVSINLDHLALTGDLKFSTLIGLKMLQTLTLSGNYFTGRIPPVIGTISTLQHLDLSNNRFVGSVPDRINDLWSLNYLNLSLNNFSGGVPTARLQNLQQLRVFDLHSNHLWADVADIFSRLRNVEVIDLSNNSFYGDLSVSSNFSGSLYTTLRYLDLSWNGLNGGFFSADAIVNFRNLVYLDLSENGLTGMLPSSFGNLPYLQVVRFRKNQLYGPVPQELFKSGIPLVELDLSGNGFTGLIPEMNSTTLRVLNISSNGFSGSFPSSIGKCTTIDMSRNMMMGDISNIVNWEDTLEVVDLSSNKLSGSLPNLTSKFEKLNTLIVSNNALVGSLPSTLGTLSNLSKVDLGSNKLSGPIPASFFVSTTLIYLNLSGNGFTGGIPLQGSRASELVVLPSSSPIETLDLSRNSLEGVLPSDIGNFGRLKFLNLSNNTLSGKLPNELSKLSDLLYLDLSRNNFEGEIPDNLPSSLQGFSVAYNDLSGSIPGSVKHFPVSSFKPGNDKLNVPKGNPKGVNGQPQIPGNHHGSKSSIRVAIIAASVGAAVMIVFVLLAYYRSQIQDFHGRSAFGGQTASRDVKIGRFSKPSIFSFHSNSDPPPTSLSFSHDHLLTSNSRSMSGPVEYPADTVEHVLPVASSSLSMIPNLLDAQPASATSGRKSSPGSPLSASPHFTEMREQPVMLDVYSPDRLAGELFFLDASLAFTAEELSRAPAEVLGRSSHGTLYKATLDTGHMLTVKWLRVGLVKHKKEFAKEIKKIGSARHPNLVPLRAYYWGPREQERLILADFIQGDSLSLHLYETTPRRYPPLAFSQRFKVAVDVARCLLYLHERGMPHGDLKPTNILLTGPNYDARLTDYCLHRLMTPSGVAEQVLNLGALGYRAPELASAAKPVPTLKADVYALGVIMMELLTRRSAGDIFSGQSGIVDLTDWVQLCDQEGRGLDCIDRDIAGGEEPSKAMEECLSLSLRCILAVDERPNIRQVYEDLCSISV